MLLVILAFIISSLQPQELLPPTIDVSQMKVTNIVDNTTGVFLADSIIIQSPVIGAEIVNVNAKVGNATIRDMSSGNTYRVHVKSVDNVAESKYQIRLGLSGKFPLARKAIMGNVQIELTARALYGDSISEDAHKEFVIKFSNQ